MLLESSPQHLAEALVSAGSYAVARPTEPSPHEGSPAYTIALSREFGAGGTSVAKAIGELLGWPVYDNELVKRIASEMQLRASLLDSVDEKQKSWLLECVEAFSSGPIASESSYVRHLIETVASLGAHGRCVIVGRGAAQILPPATTLRVRLVADLDDRIMRMSRELGLTKAEAARLVRATDRARVRFIRDHFQKDAADPCLYDVVLNTSRLSYPACAALVLETLHSLRKCAAEKEKTHSAS
jgi:cytidylate kinase